MNVFKKFAVTAAIAAATVIAGQSLAAKDNSAIAERLQPVGKTCMAGDECAKGGSMMVAANEPRAAEDIYSTKCFSCHNTGVGGAPKLGDAAAWEPRIAQGMDTLFKHAWEGFNAMPPKGICMDCSEAEMKSTIEYMVGKAK